MEISMMELLNNLLNSNEVPETLLQIKSLQEETEGNLMMPAVKNIKQPKKSDLQRRNVTKKGIRFRDHFYTADFLKELWKDSVYIHVVDGSPEEIEIFSVTKDCTFLGYAVKEKSYCEYDIERTPRCPYLGSIGEKSVRCHLHCIFKKKQEFDSQGELRTHTDNVCFKDFDRCSTYKAVYQEEIESKDKYILEYRKCAFCCNNSGYTGLRENSGSTHGFCQLWKKEKKLFNSDETCEWFNKKKRVEIYENDESPRKSFEWY